MKFNIQHIILLLFWFLIMIGCKTKQNVTNPNLENLPVQSHYQNIQIDSNASYAPGPCEPSIVINPKNPQNIVAGSVLNQVHHSMDGGATWQTEHLHSNQFGVYGDPCLVADNHGNIYYFHLSNPKGRAYTSKSFLNQIVMQTSIDAGNTWHDGIGIGLNAPKQQDKEWATVHPKTDQIYVTWTEFDKYGSRKEQHKSRIRFSTSKDFGHTFSAPKTISDEEGDAKDDDETTEGAVPAVSMEGNIYVAWGFKEKIYFDYSMDKGETWHEDIVIAEQIGGWNQNIPGIGRANGMPVTAVDQSNSIYKGNIYVNWTDQRNGSDDTDVFLVKSIDHGKTWSAPIRVNQDKTKTHQFFTWMDIDPYSGYIYIVYYDRSKYTNTQTDVVLSISKDGGKSFQAQTISESPFTPSSEVFFGDYNHIDALNGRIRPIWTRYEKGVLSIWTCLIDME